MKKIYFFISFFLLLGLISNAQRKSGVLKQSNQVLQLPKSLSSSTQKPEAGCDTIIPFPVEDSLTLYGSFSYGFVSGTNTDLDKEKADYFSLSSDNYNYITGAAVYFAYGNSAVTANLSKNVLLKVYADDNGVPGAQIGTSASIPLSSIKSDVDNGFITSILFSSPIALPSSKKFYVSVDVSNFAYSDDSIAIWSTYDSAVVPGIAWDKWIDDSWHAFSDNDDFGLKVALVILPFVSADPSACLALPVKLYSFTAQRNKNDVSLNWNVADEINMKGYEIQRADNNNNFKSVGYLSARNDPKSQAYTYTDVSAFKTSPIVQYRLKQIDADGQVQYSRVIPVKLSSALSDIVFANPFNSALHMQLNIANPSLISMNIYDMKGNLVGTEKPKMYNNTSNSVTVSSTSTLKSGVYILKLNVGDEQFNYKIVKQ